MTEKKTTQKAAAPKGTAAKSKSAATRQTTKTAPRNNEMKKLLSEIERQGQKLNDIENLILDIDSRISILSEGLLLHEQSLNTVEGNIKTIKEAVCLLLANRLIEEVNADLLQQNTPSHRHNDSQKQDSKVFRGTLTTQTKFPHDSDGYCRVEISFGSGNTRVLGIIKYPPSSYTDTVDVELSRKVPISLKESFSILYKRHTIASGFVAWIDT